MSVTSVSGESDRPIFYLLRFVIGGGGALGVPRADNGDTGVSFQPFPVQQSTLGGFPYADDI